MFQILTQHQEPDGTNVTDIVGGPDISSMYLTALYFTMTCLTSIGFGNVAAETDNEKLFTLFMMIISSFQSETNKKLDQNVPENSV